MEGSRFCSLHVPDEAPAAKAPPQEEPKAEPGRERVQEEEWASLLLAAAAVGGLLFVLGLWRKWLPKGW